MISKISSCLKFAAVSVAFVFIAGGVFAQGMLQPLGAGGKRSGKTPTIINADTMDIDISKNVAIFTGNVKVDDEEMNITCKKMTIYLEDKKPDAVAKTASKPDAAKPDAAKTDNAKQEEGKQVSRIVCEENVVIIRKSLSESERAQGTQKALAGHADYDVKTGKIVLTKNNPALMRGGDTIRGEIITIWRDDERVSVQGSSEIKMNPDSDSQDDAAKGDK